MISSVVRTVLVYLAVVVAMRLMGKRQLGELQPSELVTTLLISNVASICIDEPDLPLSASLYTSESTCPIRPTKLRLVVDTALSPAAITPICPPRHGPHVGVETTAPALTNIVMRPSSIH